MIGVAFISDRGDKYLPGCVESMRLVQGEAAAVTVIDDRDHRLGMAGAVNAAWDWAREHDVDYLLHVEEDFRFVTPVALDDLVAVLNSDLRLAQVVLKRQPWSPEEHQAGGMIETQPDAYTSHEFDGHEWVSHQRIFSLNPCLIPRHVLELGWPSGNEAEMTTNLTSLGYRFGIYGNRADPPRVIHVGVERGAGWRL